jgi:hypothetical protein
LSFLFIGLIGGASLKTFCTLLYELLVSYTSYILIFAFFAAVVRGAGIRRLRIHHPEQYRRLGEPTMLRWMNSRSSWAFDKFAFLRQDQGLNDPLLSIAIVSWLPVAVVAYCLWLACGLGVICSQLNA